MAASSDCIHRIVSTQADSDTTHPLHPPHQIRRALQAFCLRAAPLDPCPMNFPDTFQTHSRPWDLQQSSQHDPRGPITGRAFQLPLPGSKFQDDFRGKKGGRDSTNNGDLTPNPDGTNPHQDFRAGPLLRDFDSG